jgi:hypothetical protein
MALEAGDSGWGSKLWLGWSTVSLRRGRKVTEYEYTTVWSVCNTVRVVIYRVAFKVRSDWHDGSTDDELQEVGWMYSHADEYVGTCGRLCDQYNWFESYPCSTA